MSTGNSIFFNFINSQIDRIITLLYQNKITENIQGKLQYFILNGNQGGSILFCRFVSIKDKTKNVIVYILVKNKSQYTITVYST